LHGFLLKRFGWSKERAVEVVWKRVTQEIAWAVPEVDADTCEVM
jgi:hypothetical protein